MPVFQKYIVPTIGVAAFIVGGLLTQKKAKDLVVDLQEALADKDSEDS